MDTVTKRALRRFDDSLRKLDPRLVAAYDDDSTWVIFIVDDNGFLDVAKFASKEEFRWWLDDLEGSDSSAQETKIATLIYTARLQRNAVSRTVE